MVRTESGLACLSNHLPECQHLNTQTLSAPRIKGYPLEKFTSSGDQQKRQQCQQDTKHMWSPKRRLQVILQV